MPCKCNGTAITIVVDIVVLRPHDVTCSFVVTAHESTEKSKLHLKKTHNVTYCTTMGCASSINAALPQAEHTVPSAELTKLDAVSPGCSARLKADGCVITELSVIDGRFDMVLSLIHI